MKKLVNVFLDFLFPRSCIGCHKGGTALCQECVEKIPISKRDTLPSRYHALFEYRHPPLKNALWHLKYKNRKEVAEVLGARLGEVLVSDMVESSLFESFRNPIIIPIPLSRKKFKERGYNQSELIGRAAIDRAEFGGEIRTDILEKIRETEPQAKIKNRAKRLSNLNGCFSVKKPEIISNRNIILIDDITTTGATLNEARKTLLEAGARKVIGYTIAH